MAAAKGEQGAVQKGVWHVVREVYRNDGFVGFYRGLTKSIEYIHSRLQSALLRQVVYGTMRLGLYRYCADWHKASKGGFIYLLFTLFSRAFLLGKRILVIILRSCSSYCWKPTRYLFSQILNRFYVACRRKKKLQERF